MEIQVFDKVPCLFLVEAFDDGQALLRAAEEHRLEGIVSSADRHPIDRARSAIGRRSRRKPGSRRTGSGGGYSNRDQGPGKCVIDRGRRPFTLGCTAQDRY